MTTQSTSTCITASDCQPILDELMKREPVFHRHEYGTSCEALEDITDSSFWGIGASVKRCDREDVTWKIAYHQGTIVEDIS